VGRCPEQALGGMGQWFKWGALGGDGWRILCTGGFQALRGASLVKAKPWRMEMCTLWGFLGWGGSLHRESMSGH
jgi:hypothetical protein